MSFITSYITLQICKMHYNDQTPYVPLPPPQNIQNNQPKDYTINKNYLAEILMLNEY